MSEGAEKKTTGEVGEPADSSPELLWNKAEQMIDDMYRLGVYPKEFLLKLGQPGGKKGKEDESIYPAQPSNEEMIFEIMLRAGQKPKYWQKRFQVDHDFKKYMQEEGMTALLSASEERIKAAEEDLAAFELNNKKYSDSQDQSNRSAYQMSIKVKKEHIERLKKIEKEFQNALMSQINNTE